VFGASSFSLIQLKRIQTGDLAWFFQLDFTFFHQKILEKLFPVGDFFTLPSPKHTDLHPTPLPIFNAFQRKFE